MACKAREAVPDSALNALVRVDHAAARATAATKKNEEGLPVQSFRSLLGDLGTLVRNRVEPTDGAPPFDQDTVPTPLQAKAFELLGVSPRL